MLLLLQKTGIVQQRAPGSWSPGPSRSITALWQSLLPCLHMGLLLNGAFCRSLKAEDLHSPQGWDHLDYALQSFTFAGNLVVASTSKALHLSHPQQHCLFFSWAKTPFLLYNDILLTKYKLSVPLTCHAVKYGSNLLFETTGVGELG